MQKIILFIVFITAHVFAFAGTHEKNWTSDTIINSKLTPQEILKEEIYLPNMCISADISNFFVSNGYLNIDLCITKNIVGCLAFSNKINGGINVLDSKKRETKITERERMYALGIKYFHDFYKREDRSPYYLQVMLNYGSKYEYNQSKSNLYTFTGGSIGIGYCSLSDSGIYTNTDVGLGFYNFGSYVYPKIGFEIGYAF